VTFPSETGEALDLDALLCDLPQPYESARAAAQARQGELTKPPGSLGRLEEIAVWLAGWQGTPRLENVHALVFAGNHGIAARGVSPYPPEVTVQMVGNFERGGAAINQICEAGGITLDVRAIDLDRPTGDIAAGPAMSEAECEAALRTGMDAVPSAADAVVVGEMGIGNTTIAAALAACVCGGDGAQWAGPGTGLGADGITQKARLIDQALARHRAAAVTPLAALSRLGGREQAAIAGAVLAARRSRIPVVLDGFVATAAAAVLTLDRQDALSHCVAGHVSREPGHRALLDALGLDPILDLGMRLGEGTGAALAVSVLRAAAATHTGMATFADAGVSGRAE
jgi:nicotinate-nucleotide--dimethylbenzimidazole phosphoribosyltransferase